MEFKVKFLKLKEMVRVGRKAGNTVFRVEDGYSIRFESGIYWIQEIGHPDVVAVHTNNVIYSLKAEEQVAKKAKNDNHKD